MLRLPAFVIALVCTLSPALAQDDPDRCYTPSDPRCTGEMCGNTFYNPTVSQNWQQTRANADAAMMRQMAGVYYGENLSSDRTMIQRIYYSYETSGLWQYQDQTCATSGNMPCSQNQGAGQWAGFVQADGTAFVMVHFSDLSRSNTCFSQTLQFDGRQLIDVNSGTRLIRTQ